LRQGDFSGTPQLFRLFRGKGLTRKARADPVATARYWAVDAERIAAFAKGTGNGHHLKNSGNTLAVYLEVGSRHPDELTTCSDIDVMSNNRDGRFVHKDGSPYP
jgi:uncharacterized cupin superfamily protein